MILPQKKDLDKAKAQERKTEIDSGVALAKRIDALRETKESEEKQLFAWRDATRKKIQYDIDQLLEEKTNLEKQNTEARTLREKLLEPLDSEWDEIHTEKALLIKEKNLIHTAKESLKVQTEKIQGELGKISVIISRTKKKESETEKANKEAIEYRDLAQQEYVLAREERIAQSNTHEKKMETVSELRQAYENGIEVYKAHEKQLEEEKADLIIRENHIKTQQIQVKAAWAEIQRKNDSKSTDN